MFCTFFEHQTTSHNIPQLRQFGKQNKIGVSKNRVFLAPPNHPLKNRGLPLFFTIHFGGFSHPIFGNTQTTVVRHPLKSELNFPTGPKSLIHHAPERWRPGSLRFCRKVGSGEVSRLAESQKKHPVNSLYWG